MSKLTSFLPSVALPQSTWPHLKCLKLADPSFMTPTSIDFILGADVYADLILTGLITGPPIAQSTIFGWMLSGPKPDKGCNGFGPLLPLYFVYIKLFSIPQPRLAPTATRLFHSL